LLIVLFIYFLYRSSDQGVGYLPNKKIGIRGMKSSRCFQCRLVRKKEKDCTTSKQKCLTKYKIKRKLILKKVKYSKNKNIRLKKHVRIHQFMNYYFIFYIII